MSRQASYVALLKWLACILWSCPVLGDGAPLSPLQQSLVSLLRQLHSVSLVLDFFGLVQGMVWQTLWEQEQAGTCIKLFSQIWPKVVDSLGDFQQPPPPANYFFFVNGIWLQRLHPPCYLEEALWLKWSKNTEIFFFLYGFSWPLDLLPQIVL